MCATFNAVDKDQSAIDNAVTTVENLVCANPVMEAQNSITEIVWHVEWHNRQQEILVSGMHT